MKLTYWKLYIISAQQRFYFISLLLFHQFQHAPFFKLLIKHVVCASFVVLSMVMFYYMHHRLHGTVLNVKVIQFGGMREI